MEPSTYILLALSEESMHGYAIMQAVGRLSGGSVTLGPGTLYGCIKRLLAVGLIVEVADPSGSDRRRTYELTPNGSQGLALELERLRRVLDSSAARRLQSKGVLS